MLPDAGGADFTGMVTGGGVSTLAAVSAGVGAVLAVELQPGLAKIRIRAKTWIPTTMPKIFRIFIGGSVESFVKAPEGERYLKFPAEAERFCARDSN